ncbi:macrophage migration inhibitory factor homolog isoform X2 [Homarus americanus]|uniref:macrophage migration inhibitory factor homolog isoform X2 n=1 Tax=Homarus americanus TaxID=6706 RepID=UPI001C497909|nr:macrophage migration inhibitory factor homolog isoform X2 [Homarus americanus]
MPEVPGTLILALLRVCLHCGVGLSQGVTMPYLEIATNLTKEKITPEILTNLSKLLSAILGKAEQYCVVRVIPDQLMTFGGSSDPCATALLISLGKLGVEENKGHAAKIYEFVENSLGIPGDRMYIQFFDKPSSEIGYKGTTFHQLLGR